MAAVERADQARDAVRRRFAGHDGSPSAVRRFLSDVLERWGVGLGTSRDNLLLLASELATNAVQHTHAGFTVSARMTGTRAHVDVYDGEAELPRSRKPRVDSDGGRGLVLVNHLASAWGAEPAAGGKVVWFELPLDDAPAIRP